MTQLRAGFGRAVITPSLAVPHAGWGAQTHLLADGVHRDLHVSVLVLAEEGGSSEVLVEFDLVGLYALDARIREAVAREVGVPPTSVRVSATHNHANPVMWENWIGGRPEAVAEYRAGLPTAAAGAARAAKLALRPVRMAAGVGRSDIGRNRRQKVTEPDGSTRVIVGVDERGVTDPAVTVVRFDELDGAPYAAVLGYACHATTLGPDNRLHSPDYPGVAKAVFEAATGASSIFLQGAAGNVGPRHGFVADIAVVERLGAALGLEAARVFTELETRPVELVFDRARESGATLGMWVERSVPERPARLVARRETVALPLRPQPPVEEAQAEYERWQAELTRVTGDGSDASVVEATMFRARRAQMAVGRATTYGGRSSMDVTIELLRLGDVAIVGCNGEPFCEIGLAIKAASPFRVTFFGGYTGEALGYIPWPSAYEEGGYEVETSPYSPDAAPRLVAAVTEALERLAAG